MASQARDLVDDAVLLGLLGGHKEVTVSVLLDLVERLASSVRHVAVHFGLRISREAIFDILGGVMLLLILTKRLKGNKL
jgi:hypothetical protein